MWPLQCVLVVTLHLLMFGSSAGAVKKSKAPVPRITKASVGDAPAFVSLVHDDSVVCGGALIHPQYVLTTGYCAKLVEKRQLPANKIKVLFNVVQTNPINKEAVIRKIKGVWKHPRYSDYPAYWNDIGLVKLNEPVKNIKPIKLSYSPYKKYSQRATVYWFSHGNNRINVLRKTSTPTGSNLKCREIYPNKNFHSQQFICTHANNQLCNADAIMMEGEYISGLVSQTGCGDEFPDVYQRISFHYKTIKSAIANWKN